MYSFLINLYNRIMWRLINDELTWGMHEVKAVHYITIALIGISKSYSGRSTTPTLTAMCFMKVKILTSRDAASIVINYTKEEKRF